MKIILGSSSKWRKNVLERMGYKFAEATPHLPERSEGSEMNEVQRATPRPENGGSEFEVMAPDIDEKTIRFDDPKLLALALANAKADALLPKIQTRAILITSDQVDVCNGEIREKPKDAQEAREFLRSYNKHPVQTITAVVVVNTVSQKRKEGVDIAKVYFRPLTEEKIQELVASGLVFSCAGGFCIIHPTFKDCVQRVEGEIESVAGLPRELTERLIKEVQN